MKALLSPRNLKLLIPGCGILGLLLRLLVNATGIDGKGLLISNHPALILLWVLTAAAVLALLLGTRSIQGPEGHQASFPASPLAAVGCVLAAVSAFLAACTHFRTGPAVSGAPNLLATAAFYLTGILMALAAAAFVLIALCRLWGRKPTFLLHVAVCIHFALQMLNLYQNWSFDPQIYDYCFQLFACIALAMTAYQLAAFDMGKGNHRKLWTWGLAAVYLCCLAVGDRLFFLTGAIWAFTNLSNLRRPRQRKRMEPDALFEGDR